MSTPLPQPMPRFAAATWPRALPHALPRASAWRAALVAGTLVAITLAAALAQPSAALLADADLAFLLRGMAAIKAALVLLALALIGWRLGRPTAPAVAALYLLGAWLMAGATVLVWQLSAIPAAALAFHAGEITLLLVAWRDHGDARAKEPRGAR